MWFAKFLHNEGNLREPAMITLDTKILQEKLHKQIIPARILLGKFSFIDDNARKSHAYVDPNYMPFYYYLGGQVKAKNLAVFGVGIGISAACYLMGNQAENFVCLQETGGEYYSPRLARSNILRVYNNKFNIYYGNCFGEFFDEFISKKWDLVIYDNKGSYDDQMSRLNLIWEYLAPDGVLCMDGLKWDANNKRVFNDFAKVKNREKFEVRTRYGIGLLPK
jgi:hypothetical protein